jgi:hypothetical protein
MNQIVYSRDEIESEHDYARPHQEMGQTLHGGFDSNGQYISPRTKIRWQAINSWHKQLESRGCDIVEATTDLLIEPNFPNEKQQLFLLQHGLGQGFWDSLTITGLIEGRGRALADIVAPDFQEIIEESIEGTALSHMNKGLLRAHGWDEGGDGSDVGGHDAMWFVLRDLVMGKDAYPIPEAPASIGRDRDEREIEQLPPEHEGLISFLMNLLMIEVRAERAFSFYQSVLLDESVFQEKRAEAVRAAEMVERIRQDESVHVAWLRVAISEFRSFTVKTNEGTSRKGAELIDPIWKLMVRWHAVDMHDANRDARRSEMEDYILAQPGGDQLLDGFNRLAA